MHAVGVVFGGDEQRVPAARQRGPIEQLNGDRLRPPARERDRRRLGRNFDAVGGVQRDRDVALVARQVLERDIG